MRRWVFSVCERLRLVGGIFLFILSFLSFGAMAVEPLSVSGNQILIGGNQGSLAGNSYFWSNNGWGGEKYYNASTVGWLKSDWNSTVVRAAMGVEDPGGYFDDPAGNEAKVRAIVDAAIANDMYVIIDWHSHYANTHDWSRAISFFQRMAQDYGHTNNVIYEVFNEPKQVSWSADIKPYAEAIIGAIRAIDPDNLIIVGTPTWSQDVDQASFDPITGYTNIAYTLHFYAGTHGQYLRDKAQTALNNGIALFVTEWGTVNADGNGAVNHGETDVWMNFLKSNNISHANWSINDKSEGASSLVPGASGTGGWSGSQLTESGNKVRDIIRNWGGLTLPPPPPQECYAASVPAHIEAEDYCSMQGVQTEATSDAGGGSNVGWLDPGDSLTYKINVATAGDYDVSYRVAGNNGSGAFQLGNNPVVNVPDTGGWQNWTTVTQTLALAAGEQEITLAVVSAEFNLNWIKFEESDFTDPVDPPPPPTSGSVRPLSVSGNQVLAGGQPASFAGNSLFWSNNGWGDAYYNSNVVSWLKSDWQSPLIRAAMGVEDGGGYLEDPQGNKSRVKAVVDAAVANDMYVIIDWHSHHAEQYTAQSIAFFQEMATNYGHLPNVIYEIYNEPLQVSWSGTIKPYAEQVIAAIRAIDPDNLIVVGTPTWSQDVDAAAADPITSHSNIAYALHFYVGTHGQSLRDKAQNALNMGAALFVTEWGFWGAGNTCCDYGEADAWANFLKTNNISSAAWSIIDKPEPSSHLVPGSGTQGGWSDSQLTSAGLYVRDMIRNWNGNQPQECVIASVGVRIEAERYCAMSGVQTEATSDQGGGENVGWLDAGDWLEYEVDIAEAGLYSVDYRVASESAGGQLSLSVSGTTLADLSMPVTGGWQNWADASHQVNLNAGVQRIRLAISQGGFNLNWFQINQDGTPPPPPPTGEPIFIEAENYTYMSGVQTEATSDAGGGQNVGYIDAGDWMAYHDINVKTAGTYQVEFRIAAETGGGSISLEQNEGTTVLGTINVQATGGWQNWTTISMQVQLNAGQQNFGVGVPQGGYNLNWIRMTPVVQ
nr:cellulase family glycosylhydrolase [Microbulbifer salipaludis]